MSTTERVRFPGALGGDLAARIEIPPGAPRGWVLFAHCFTCSKDLKAVRRISRALVDEGFGVMRFDFTGIGESDGSFADTNFSSNLDDVVAAADYLVQRHGGPLVLVGHSLGGAAVLAAATRVPAAVGVATIAAPSDTEHLAEILEARAPRFDERGEASFELAGKEIRVKQQLIDDLRDQRVLDSVARLERPLLVLHSPVDEAVAIEHATRIYRAARHPKSFVSLDDADHLLLRDPRDAHYVGTVLAAWVGRYLEPQPAADEPLVEEGEVRVSGGEDGLAQQIVAGPHRLRSDEPRGVGGMETGPTPYDLLLAGLGSCTSMTLRLYADRKGWPLTGVDVLLRHRRIHAADCADCETTQGRVDEIRRKITIEGPLDEGQRARLLEIADRCPVHRTLSGEIKIRTETAPSEGAAT